MLPESSASASARRTSASSMSLRNRVHRLCSTAFNVALISALISECNAFVHHHQHHHQHHTHINAVQTNFRPAATTFLTKTTTTSANSRMIPLSAKMDDEEDEDDDYADLNSGDSDWRAFRAKLVMSSDDASAAASTDVTVTEAEDEDVDGIGKALQQDQPPLETSTNTKNPFSELKSENWAYEAGNVIERGSIILGGIEQDFGFGLRQQYFHKTVILVLDHDDKTFTKGLILNRPSDRTFQDEFDREWQVWFGGDVQSLDEIRSTAELTCLHSLENEAAQEVSTSVYGKELQYCSFENAARLVQNGTASQSDFWTFGGYAGWGPNQLAGELERKSWYMIAADSGTLLNELKKQSQTANVRDAGLETWELLMGMIGKGDAAEESKDGLDQEFDDNMLKEWARANLVYENVLMRHAWVAAVAATAEQDVMESDLVTDREIEQTRYPKLAPGTLIRSTRNEQNIPSFLLTRQEYHQSLILILSDDESITLGLLLNRVSARGIDRDDVRKEDPMSDSTSSDLLPIRYGGEYAIRGQGGMAWFHCNNDVKNAGLGTPLAAATTIMGAADPTPVKPESYTREMLDGIWACTPQQAHEAISQNLASHKDFLVVNGVSVWPKERAVVAAAMMGRALGGNFGSMPKDGLAGEIQRGEFEVVSTEFIRPTVKLLLQQELLTVTNVYKNLELAKQAWQIMDADSSADEASTASQDVSVTMEGIGEGYDEEDESLVYKSDVKVADLTDDALRKWVSTFLLGSP